VPKRPPEEPRSGKPAATAGDEAIVDDKLKRERAGTYRTGDGRFTVEQSSSGWLLLDEEQADELGLPLARGPFVTLDEARAAIAAARSGPRPISTIAGRTPARARSAAAATRASTDAAGFGRAAGRRPDGSTGTRAGSRRDAGSEEQKSEEQEGTPVQKAPLRALKSTDRARARPAVVVREIRMVDGNGLRELWREVGFHSIGDDDRSLARLARRNPGLVLVAAEGSRIVGSALGGWDGRRGWMYHVATAETHRRQGIATRLVTQVETGLGDLGCPKISVMVSDENTAARAFWSARGYSMAPTRQLSRMLDEG
jgi:ribosomal protein S18 acetylase RimI-like enzyme